MKRIFWLPVLLAFLLIFLVYFTASADEGNSMISIEVGNELYKEDYKVFNNSIYIPLRKFCDMINIAVSWNGENRNVDVDINNKQVPLHGNTVWNEEGVIPNENVAYTVGKTILEAYMGKSLEYETDKGVYYLKVVYHKYDNSWRVYQECKYKIGGGGGTGIYSPTVVMNKNTGEVTYINTDTHFE